MNKLQRPKEQQPVGLATRVKTYTSGLYATEAILMGLANFEDAIITTKSITTVFDDNGAQRRVTEPYESSTKNGIVVNGNHLAKDALYYLINVSVHPIKTIAVDGSDLEAITLTDFDTVVAVINGNNSELQRNGVYLHGRAGIYDEVDYFNERKDDQILPTKWYGKQEPFEFEFVVSQPTGLHKILDNLVIISNNVKPEELEVTVIGDVYDFNKAGIYWSKHCTPDDYHGLQDHEFDEKYNKPHRSFLDGEDVEFQVSQSFKKYDSDEDQVDVIWDHVTDTYSLKVKQDCKDAKDPRYGRLLGNIQYKEDSWYSVIEPIRYNSRIKFRGEIVEDSQKQSTRIRDKFFKVRVRYSGEDLAIITSIKSLITMSYA